ncbi:DUF4124 domain-containing protein [Glaciimonas sp. PAMC28666]|uniref:DUF4124 domain-containing protein n=1 Tax=Glaciimonas sp. PAMC28666 TaxID=2807626 RepID=UPI001963439C|nr:DUF4124 domain-containing protein [Glaciimonas sp. PAMC28666]QRX84038.1 DUF4124 domain-containing protein [Glaciimonas sp. PAMC28666]
MNSDVQVQLNPPLNLPRLPHFRGAFHLARLTFYAIAFICVLPSPAVSQIFICKDGAGRTITSDHPTPECADRAMRELSNAGLLRREIPAPLNAEQKHQLQLQEEKHRIAAAALEEQHQQDKALMARYRSENDITASRRYYLALSQDMIKRDQASIVEAEGQLKAAQADAEFYKNKKLPAPVQWKIDDAQQALVGSKTSLSEHQQEAAGINAKFDETLTRYRTLSLDQANSSNR